MPYTFKILSSITEISVDNWNAVTGTDYPFTRHEFLHALEASGATGKQCGWETRHVLVYDNTNLIAIMPSYLKQHSFAEYVFDHAWADAYHRHGVDYYPKLVSAIPFSPVTGQRICIVPTHDAATVHNAIKEFIIEYCRTHKLSSWHLLFPEKSISDQLDHLSEHSSDQFAQRTAVHFQWFNEGFTNFDEFLALFSSRKRKNLKKERLQVARQSISLEVFEGSDIPEHIWERFYYFYQMTYAKRSGHGGYLCKSFFQQLAKTMPESLVLVLAKVENEGDEEYIAGALNLRDSNTLYGRYWGCLQEFKHLHFETCYYQGIDYCIKEGLTRFDPGVQGEHKIQRGFRPVFTYSNHWIKEPGFRAAIGDFLKEEKEMIEAYQKQTSLQLPFKCTTQKGPS